MVHIISWIVQKGKSIGKKIGFPTMNIHLDSEEILDSVFKINVIIDKKIYPWIGTYTKNRKIFESHIFNFSKNTYWENIKVYLLEKVRNNKKFTSTEELKKQISKDIEIVKNKKIPVLTFWAFDIAHKWHKYYLSEAKKYGDILITIIGTDANIKKIKGFFPENSQKKRLSEIKKFKISDKVEIWSNKNPMEVIEKYSPKYICIGYDQKWFVEMMRNYISKKNISLEIITISSYHPEKFKSSLLKQKK